jgi:peptidoglycan hydrolase FlgJ
MLPTINAQAFTDFSSLSNLKRDARNDPQENLRAVAQQFESLYLNMMLKSMRAASFGDPLFDSSNGEMYRDMYDNQIALQMSQQKGIGLADMLVKQLQQNLPAAKPEDTNDLSKVNTDVVAPGVTKASAALTRSVASHNQADPTRFESQKEFVETLMPYAESAAQELGVSPQVLIAQAALETGWGNATQTLPNGKSSYNLFNIKADQRWQGPKLNVKTLEYDNGVASQQQAAFRVYQNYQQSFQDYVDFIKGSPRYETALKSAESPQAYTQELQQAGYATDPHYADKVMDILQRNVISAPLSNYMLDT